eukprot:scaffold77466_cov26-Tisochrysis_lutea.AAC.3
MEAESERESARSRVALAKRRRELVALRPHGGRCEWPMLSGLMSRCITPLQCKYWSLRRQRRQRRRQLRVGRDRRPSGSRALFASSAAPLKQLAEDYTSARLREVRHASRQIFALEHSSALQQPACRRGESLRAGRGRRATGCDNFSARDRRVLHH